MVHNQDQFVHYGDPPCIFPVDSMYTSCTSNLFFLWKSLSTNQYYPVLRDGVEL